jgi:Mlc titration factor MtfA (ptsG expression regulator)
MISALLRWLGLLVGWPEQRRRQRILSSPFPPAWYGYLKKNVRFYNRLSEPEQRQLRDRIQLFIEEKAWEGCGGLEMTDEIKVTIAAQACHMVLGFPDYCFDTVRTILVYPEAYLLPGPHRHADGLVHDGPLPAAGEAWRQGGMIVLSWADVRKGGTDSTDGRNVVFHEFAHQLDMLDGHAGGMPPLPNRASERQWHEVVSEEFARLKDAEIHGRVTLLDQYGATNEAEFFAVATECFFERPVEMARAYPRLFELLRDFYRRDPATNPTSSAPIA